MIVTLRDAWDYLELAAHVEDLDPRFGLGESHKDTWGLQQVKPVIFRPRYMPSTKCSKRPGLGDQVFAVLDRITECWLTRRHGKPLRASDRESCRSSPTPASSRARPANFEPPESQIRTRRPREVTTKSGERIMPVLLLLLTTRQTDHRQRPHQKKRCKRLGSQPMGRRLRARKRQSTVIQCSYSASGAGALPWGAGTCPGPRQTAATLLGSPSSLR